MSRKYYDLREFTPQASKEKSLAEIEKSYKSMRKLAMARVRELKKAGYGDYEITQVKFPTPKQIGLDDKRAKYKILREQMDIARFLNKKISTVAEMRDYIGKSIETLHSHGYDFVNTQNFQQWTEFIEYAKSNMNMRKLYGAFLGKIKEIFQSKPGDVEAAKRALDEWVESEGKN